MAVIVQRRRIAETYKVPAGGEILWYGLGGSLPSGFVLDSYMADVFVRGANIGGSSNTTSGSDSHTHTNPASTGTQAAHTHTTGAANVGSASGSEDIVPTSNLFNANTSHGHSGTAGVTSSAGGHSHTLASTVAATSLPPYKRLYLIRASVDAEFPIGGIIMWNGPIADRPMHTNLCDGSLGTLDLRSYFIRGAAVDEDLGESGGAVTHTHDNVTTGSAGSHTHSVNATINGTGDNSKTASGHAGGTLASEGGHDHGFSTTTASDADHTHTVGATDAASNLPLHLKLYFLMRTD